MQTEPRAVEHLCGGALVAWQGGVFRAYEPESDWHGWRVRLTFLRDIDQRRPYSGPRDVGVECTCPADRFQVLTDPDPCDEVPASRRFSVMYWRPRQPTEFSGHFPYAMPFGDLAAARAFAARVGGDVQDMWFSEVAERPADAVACV